MGNRDGRIKRRSSRGLAGIGPDHAHCQYCGSTGSVNLNRTRGRRGDIVATETFIVDCPVCKAKVAAEEKGRAEQKYFNEYAGEPYGKRLSVGECPRCSTLLLGVSHQTHFEGFEGDEEDAWSEPVRQYPNPAKTFSSVRIPNAVTVSLTEGSGALQASAYFAACVMFGRALEAVCRDVLFSPEEKEALLRGQSKKYMMLAIGINQLRQRNIIDDRLFDWSQHLHAFRNIAAHPDNDATSISREDAEDLQTFVYAIIEYIYDLTDRYDEFKGRQEKRQAAKAKRKNPAAPGGTRFAREGDDDRKPNDPAAKEGTRESGPSGGFPRREG
jgi:hypothetical protein